MLGAGVPRFSSRQLAREAIDVGAVVEIGRRNTQRAVADREVDAGALEPGGNLAHVEPLLAEGEQPGPFGLLERANDLPASALQGLGRVLDQAEDVLLHWLRAQPEKNPASGVEAPNAGKVHERLLEPPGIPAVLELVVHVRFMLVDAVIADVRRVEQLERFAVAIEESGADGPEEPLVRSYGHEIDVVPAHVH